MCCANKHRGQPQTSHDLVSHQFGDDGWCVCRGENNGFCCGYATKNDGMCDRCRTHCAPNVSEKVADETVWAAPVAGSLVEMMSPDYVPGKRRATA